VCYVEFPNKKALLIHEKDTGHYYKFACDMCDKRFRQKIQLTRHEAQVHSNDSPYQCDRCDRKFKSEYSWKRHQSNDEVHEKMKNYTPYLNCEICGKQFERRRKWCLDQHMFTHQPDKKFYCDLCGKTFRSANYLACHVKACSGVKEEECAFCGQHFTKKSVRINHERLHTGEAPYQCRICNERFRTHTDYCIHGKSAHKAATAQHFSQLQIETTTELDMDESNEDATNISEGEKETDLNISTPEVSNDNSMK